MNPARALGPEIVFNSLGRLLGLPRRATAIGAAVAALAYEWLYLGADRLPVVGTPASGVDEPRPGEAAVS